MRFDLHNSLKACAGLMVISLLAFTVLLLTPYQTWAKDNYTQNHDNDGERTKAALEKMTVNGLLNAIDRVGGSYALQLKAIAIRESDGFLDALNKKSLTLCAFQVHPMHFDTYAAKNGMTRQQFMNALVTSPEICAETGAAILMGHIDRQGPVGGFCGYAGTAEYKIFQKTGTCPMYTDVEIYMNAINGTLTQEVIADIKSPDYGNIILRGASGKLLTILNCQDHSKEFARALVDAHKAYMGAMSEDADETAWLDAGSEASKPQRDARGKITMVYCLFPLIQYFDTLRLLVGGLEALQNIIWDWSQSLLNAVCSYLTKFNETLIFSELAKHCISLPDLNLGVDLPALDRKTCGSNSLSLGTILATDQGLGNIEDLISDAAGWQSSKGLPPVKGLLTNRPESPNLFYNLRRQ
ncbi:MAG TPA: hypothetical protein DCY07_01500 [Rhodospirillaceae bacterium]|nr:hypothetical protein [Rhodospirillaceae bacterium]